MTMVEILISLSIFMLSISALTRLEMSALQSSADSTQRVMATTRANSMIDRIMLNNDSLALGKYLELLNATDLCVEPPSKNCASLAGGDLCSSVELAAFDVDQIFCTTDSDEQSLDGFSSKLTCGTACESGDDFVLTFRWVARTVVSDPRLEGKTIVIDGETVPASTEQLRVEFVP